MRFCPNCGAAIAENADSCVRCGAETRRYSFRIETSSTVEARKGQCKWCRGSGECRSCRGTGFHLRSCFMCGGTGRSRKFVFFGGRVTCFRCGGSGFVPERCHKCSREHWNHTKRALCERCNGTGNEPCHHCGGKGRCAACEGSGWA